MINDYLRYDDFRRMNHNMTDIRYYFVWTTYETKKILTDNAASLCEELVKHICETCRLRVVDLRVQPDNVALCVIAPPSISPSEIMKRVKGKTSKVLQEAYPQFCRKYLGQFIWARGFYCATVGLADSDQIKSFIWHQGPMEPVEYGSGLNLENTPEYEGLREED